MFESAIQRAKELDKLTREKKILGPLHGIPISVKDTFQIRGCDTSIGIASLVGRPAEKNAVIVDCLLDAGAVIYCKTNVPQTLMALDTHNNVFGRTINPSNTAVTAGGSSGGEGALLAMHGSVLGIGSDIAGSIRIPAMCNGIYAVKPSWERLPYAGQQDGSLPGASKVGVAASIGPLTRSVRDLDLFFRAILGQRPWRADADVVYKPWTPPIFKPERRLRIGFLRSDGLTLPHPPILKLLDEVEESIKDSGTETMALDMSSEISSLQALANSLFNIEGGNNMQRLLENEPLSPWLSERFRAEEPQALLDVIKMNAQREEVCERLLAMWQDDGGDIDAIICPVAPHPVPPIDRYNTLNYTSSFVLLNYPAGVLPVRKFRESDMEGEMSATVPLGPLDEVNRRLCKLLLLEMFRD